MKLFRVLYNGEARTLRPDGLNLLIPETEYIIDIEYCGDILTTSVFTIEGLYLGYIKYNKEDFRKGSWNLITKVQ